MRLSDVAIQSDRLIADHTFTFVWQRGIDPVSIKIRLGLGYKERARLMQHMWTREIHVAPIHDIDCTGLGEQHIERMNIVQLSIGYMDEARDVAAQVQQSVHFHCGLGGTKMRPRVHG